ncbi:hypothetical protein FFJ24_005450 [Pedobacter sp. KBS0701]|uniref:hypothetical protein n=1 Tax=Pedobacter sp. KBS0701 TaxID=2578106 RepID=UPI00110E7E46|nr:hypothetical protein [Pedobacter sp. KBS0701]QDW24296.1 hypothetical protein FFJ24_005450 [Pedobacter sp. KBS0701]
MDHVRGKTDDGKWKDNARRIVVEDQKDKDQFSVGNFQSVVSNELNHVNNLGSESGNISKSTW